MIRTIISWQHFPNYFHMVLVDHKGTEVKNSISLTTFAGTSSITIDASEPTIHFHSLPSVSIKSRNVFSQHEYR